MKTLITTVTIIVVLMMLFISANLDVNRSYAHNVLTTCLKYHAVEDCLRITE